ncbi:MAG: 2-oxo acid dehydrogenase subunit E2 [bacterium]|nr:2-oxo acid dehydrogenase subunit E2 [bacterium]
MATEFKLPDLGEGVTSGEVARVLVAQGDPIKKEQAILELETDKALIEVPSDKDGTVVSVNVKEGDTVPVGAVLITIDETVGAPAAEAGKEEPEEEQVKEEEPEEEQAEETPEKPAAEKPAPVRTPVQAPPQAEGQGPVPAAPATRRFARELGVDLSQVTGTGAGGRITREDVKAFTQNVLSGAPASSGLAIPAPALPDFSRWGEVERQPLRQIRKKIAENLSIAWNQIPHVTQFDQADVSDLEAFRQRHKATTETRGGKLTPTVLILKAVITALKAFPQFNSSLDTAAGELVLKNYYNIGIAVDSDRGLLVPVIRNVDRKDIFELAAELSELADRTRQGKASLEELQGGTFTVTNLGSISGTAFTPIVNFPEVSILGIAQSRQEAVVRNGRIEPRLIMPICLSYDHRVIDGADGARFTKHLVTSLENPEQMLLGG